MKDASENEKLPQIKRYVVKTKKEVKSPKSK